MSLNLTELKDEPLGLAPTSADYCVPGTCFGDLTDEQLGKHPIPAMVCGCNVTCWTRLTSKLGKLCPRMTTCVVLLLT